MSEASCPKPQSSPSQRIAVLNIVLNFILSRGWTDYDGFARKLTERVIRSQPTLTSDVESIIRRSRGSFFRFNSIDRERFASAFPSKEVLKALTSEVVLRAKDIERVHQVMPSVARGPQRIYVDDVESFGEVARVSTEQVINLVPLSISEEYIKRCICEILGEPIISKHWGGEKSDLFTDVRCRGSRIPAAFLLKGRGTRGKLTVAKCGKNGDQILRLVQEPATIFFVQHVGNIDSYVVKLLEIALASVMRQKRVYYCIMDGVDTARLLLAYNKLPPSRSLTQ